MVSARKDSVGAQGASNDLQFGCISRLRVREPASKVWLSTGRIAKNLRRQF
jgi:hypothetical protein